MNSNVCVEFLAKVSAFIDHELAETEVVRFEEHLTRCHICLERFLEMVRVDNALYMNSPKGHELHRRLVSLVGKAKKSPVGDEGSDLLAAGGGEDLPPLTDPREEGDPTKENAQ